MYDVVVELPLHPLAGERFPLRSTSTEEFARLDIATSGVWGEEGKGDSSDYSWTFECSTRMLPPVPRCQYPPYTSGHDAEKRRQYGTRVCDIEHISFVPIVFSVACRGM